MKNFSILLLCFFLSFLGKAQLALIKITGEPISNGQVFTYNTTVEDIATFKYIIKNTSTTEPINVRIKIVSIQNSTGSGFQFCYLNTCLPSVSTNAIYPSNSNPAITIDPNSETPATGYNMWNSNMGVGVFPIDYVVKFYQVNAFNTEIGTPITITYRYDPNAILTVDDIKKSDYSFANVPVTIFKNNMQVISSENISYNLYNMEGKTLLKGNLKKGEEEINTSSINTGNYIIVLKNSNGEIISKKVIKNNF